MTDTPMTWAWKGVLRDDCTREQLLEVIEWQQAQIKELEWRLYGGRRI